MTYLLCNRLHIVLVKIQQSPPERKGDGSTVLGTAWCLMIALPLGMEAFLPQDKFIPTLQESPSVVIAIVSLDYYRSLSKLTLTPILFEYCLNKSRILQASDFRSLEMSWIWLILEALRENTLLLRTLPVRFLIVVNTIVIQTSYRALYCYLFHWLQRLLVMWAEYLKKGDVILALRFS